VARSCDLSTEGGKLHGWLSDYQLLKKGSAPCSYLKQLSALPVRFVSVPASGEDGPPQE
jgi:hypothetical protein